ncbi:Peptidase M16 inactive domain protein [Tsuneonella dongtanensis]|uniref:Peptidase M16 inactive domain protein n=1 Tax=Tsuneonella dongtanensis TaxID=692370 RepID=A0A1B2ABL5_9SPHN|nr:insulinase family protein [Tsuneonella dongtanensis]ANY19527.1 Peptidase M16 inactive domain protein [Tsuneonella dongtanensis]
MPAWEITSSDLPADPAVRFGTLPSGMRYAIKHHENPKAAAAIRMAFDVGKREEADGEINAAHFVEYMAFNGSTNIPEGELIKRLERLGLAFGADSNAETDIEHTTYKLDLPNLNPETVDAGFTVMREIASELTIAQAAVDRERGILVSEYNQRNTPPLRRLLDLLQKGIPGSRFGPQLVGDPDSIRAISAEGLRAYYNGYYRPERATLVVVGDVDVDAMEAEIKKRFSGRKGTGEARENYLPTIAVPAQPVVATFSDPSIAELIQFDRVTPARTATNTVADVRRDYLEAIANQALANRFNALARQDGSPIIGGQAMAQDLGRSAQVATLLVIAKDGEWKAATTIGEQQLRRARQYGFTASEITEIKANILANLKNAAEQADGRKSSAIADALTRASLSDQVPLAPETALAAYQAISDSIDAAAVSAAFAGLWDGGPTLVHVSTKTVVEGGNPAIAAALTESAKVAVTAPVEEVTKAFAYETFGPAGKVVADTTIADLGIRTVRFANGVQLNMKKTDFVPGQVLWRAEIGSGARVFPQGKPGLDIAAGIMTQSDGLGQHDPEELRRILAGRKASTGLSVEGDAIVSAGSSTREDIGLQLKLIAAQITDPAWRATTGAQWAGVAPVLAKNILGNPTQRFGSALSTVLASGDDRVGLGDPAALPAITMDDVRAALTPQLSKGGIEIGLVGDIDEAAMIAAVASTLGALSARGEPGAASAPVSPLVFPADRAVRTIPHNGAADQGLIGVAWSTEDGKDHKDTLERELLAAVMQLRLTDVLREELGASYTPQALSSASLTFDDYGFLVAFAPAEPASMDTVAAAVKRIAAGLIAAPPSEDEILRARQPIVQRWDRQLRENSGWSSLVTEAQSRPELLDRRRQRADVMNAITAKDLQAAAQRYLDPAKALEVRALPQPAAGQ